MDGVISEILAGILIGLPIILVVIYLSAYYLCRFGQAKAMSALRMNLALFQEIQICLDNSWFELQQYLKIESGPYFRMVTELYEDLDRLVRESRRYMSLYGPLRIQAQKLSDPNWKNTVGLPVVSIVWMVIHQRSQTLTQELLVIRDRVKRLDESISEVSELPNKLGEKLRYCREQAQILSSRAQKLRELHLTGDIFDSTIRDIQQLTFDLGNAPPVGDARQYPDIGVEETYANLGTVNEILGRCEPELHEISNRITLWEQSHTRAIEQIHKMQSALDQVNKELVGIDAALNPSAQVAQIRSLVSIANVLHATVDRAEVDNLEQITGEARKVAATAKDISYQLKHAPQQLANFEAGLEALKIRHRMLSAQIAGLAGEKQAPVVWQERQAILMELGKELAALSESEKNLEMERIENNLVQINNLENQQRRLQRELDQLREQHADLIIFLQHFKVNDFKSWMQNTREFLQQIHRYSSANWSTKLEVEQMPAKCDVLELDYRKLELERVRDGIRETELSKLLDAIKEFVARYQELHSGMDQVRRRFEELVQIDNQVKDRFGTIQGSFQQLVWVANSNPLLVGEYKSQIGTLNQWLEKLKNDIRMCEQGQLEVKADQLDQFAEALFLAGMSWVDYLNQDLNRLYKQIETKLERVSQLLTLQDPVVERLNQFLRQQLVATGNLSEDSQFPREFVFLINQLKQRNDRWQECRAALNEFTELVERPLLEANLSFEKSKDRAIKIVDEMRALKTDQSWPPTTVDLESECVSFEQIKRTWEELNRSELRAIWAVRRYGDLIAKIQAWNERGEQLLSWARQEYAQFEKMEKDFKSAQEAWRKKEHEHAGDPLVVAQIRKLRAQMNQELDEIKMHLRMNAGNLSSDDLYYEALHDFTHLIEQLRYAEIASDLHSSVEGTIRIRSEL